jgi:guanine deaminase
MEWLEHYTFSSEARIDADPFGLGQRVYSKLVSRMIESGTTLASAFGTLTVEANMVLARCFLEAGIRAHVGKVNMDLNGIATYIETTAESLSRTRDFVSSISALVAPLPPNRRLVQPVITPRFIPTCSGELMKGLVEIADEGGLRVQSHMCESEGEVQWSKGMWEGKTDVQVLHEVS